MHYENSKKSLMHHIGKRNNHVPCHVMCNIDMSYYHATSGVMPTHHLFTPSHEARQEWTRERKTRQLSSYTKIPMYWESFPFKHLPKVIQREASPLFYLDPIDTSYKEGDKVISLLSSINTSFKSFKEGGLHTKNGNSLFHEITGNLHNKTKTSNHTSPWAASFMKVLA